MNELKGTLFVPFDKNGFAEFKKIGIEKTTAAIGSLFKLKFTLDSNPQIYVISNTINVVSHTNYITKPQLTNNANIESLPKIQITKIIPNSARSGDYCTILGNNFFNSHSNPISIKFGDSIALNFHLINNRKLFNHII